MITPILGRPRIGTERQVTHRTVSRQGMWDFLSNGATVKVTASRDPGNTEDIALLRPGLLMGKITSGGMYAPSALGITTAALTNSGTTVSAAAAVVTELVRRVGATGTFKLTGPPAAAGVPNAAERPAYAAAAAPPPATSTACVPRTWRPCGRPTSRAISCARARRCAACRSATAAKAARS